MGDLVAGDDGLPAEDVGGWVKSKHKLLCDYVQISTYARGKFLGSGKGGAAYVDLFCGPGRCLIHETGEWADGGCVAAWKQSVRSGKPFSRVIIGDADPERLAAAAERLTRLGAPLLTLPADTALNNAAPCYEFSPRHGLNFAFLDPYKLEALDFGIFRALSRLKRIDFLVHVSTMDLQRNFDRYSQQSPSPFDAFAPGWREAVELDGTQKRGRKDVFDHWRDLVSTVGAEPSRDVKLISGRQGQRLYWLLLAAGHELAQTFWSKITKAERQGTLDL